MVPLFVALQTVGVAVVVVPPTEGVGHNKAETSVPKVEKL